MDERTRGIGLHRAGERIDRAWQPRHIPGDIEGIAWRGWVVDPNRPLTDLALALLRHARDTALARRTVEGYDGVAARFIRFLDGGNAEATASRRATVADLHTESIYAYLQRPRQRGGTVSLGAQRSEGGALRTLTTFGIEIGAVPADALRAFTLPKAAESEDDLPTTLRDGDVVRLLRHLDSDTTYEGCRLHLWCALALDTGVRPAELAGLKLAAVDRAEREIRILGKGAKNRTVYYGEASARVLERYLRFRGEAKRPELLLGHRGPMTAGSFSHAFGELAQTLGLAACIDGTPAAAAPTPYILRRTFARRFAEGGGAVEELARLLGHEPSSIPMLLRTYYRPSAERLRRAHRRVRPLDLLVDAAA